MDEETEVSRLWERLHDLGGRYEALEAERDRLRAEVKVERRINEMAGCPDCGVHAGCIKVVAERDRLRAVVEGVADELARILAEVLDIGPDATAALYSVAATCSDALDIGDAEGGSVDERDDTCPFCGEPCGHWAAAQVQTDAAEAAAEAVGAMAEKLTALMAERERLQEELAEAMCNSQSMEGALHDAEAELDRVRAVELDLRILVGTYVGHRPACAFGSDHPCDCGLEEALRRLDRPERNDVMGGSDER